MSRLPALTGKQLLTVLQHLGFESLRVEGSHHFLRHPDGRTTVLPIHAGKTICARCSSRETTCYAISDGKGC